MTEPLGTLTRHWLLLSRIPRAPRKVDTATLARHLGAEGFAVSRRSIQRDLHHLATVFPLEVDDQRKPYGWSWAREAAPFDLPAMDPRTAMTFRLMGRYLPHLLPRAAWASLAPHLARAEAALDALDDHRFARWPDKVRVVPDAVAEAPPHIEPDVLEAVYDALLDERVLQLTHRRPGAEARTRDVHPLGLVFRGPLAYLVATPEGREAPVSFALWRVARAAPLARPRVAPAGFSLDAFLASGDPGYRLSPAPIRLVVRVRRYAAGRLIDAPPGEAPVLDDDGDAHVLLSTTLPDTRPMRAWLLGFGEALEVLEPRSLREAIAAQLREAASRYG